MCGGFGAGALWGAEQAEISPSVPPLPSPAFLHCITPARATQRWGHGPQRATLSLSHASPGEGSEATATSSAAGVLLLSL